MNISDLMDRHLASFSVVRIINIKYHQIGVRCVEWGFVNTL